MSDRERKRCAGTNKNGKPCKRWAKDGAELCASHLGLTARATSLTEEVHRIIVEALEAGSYRNRAIEAAGIGESTFYRWLETGEADAELGKDTMHSKLWEAVKSAEAIGEVAAVQRIRSASVDSWQAAAWLLERKYPARWGRRLELGGEVRNPAGALDLSKLSNDELRELQRLTGKAARE